MPLPSHQWAPSPLCLVFSIPEVVSLCYKSCWLPFWGHAQSLSCWQEACSIMRHYRGATYICDFPSWQFCFIILLLSRCPPLHVLIEIFLIKSWLCYVLINSWLCQGVNNGLTIRVYFSHVLYEVTYTSHYSIVSDMIMIWSWYDLIWSYDLTKITMEILQNICIWSLLVFTIIFSGPKSLMDHIRKQGNDSRVHG